MQTRTQVMQTRTREMQKAPREVPDAEDAEGPTGSSGRCKRPHGKFREMQKALREVPGDAKGHQGERMHFADANAL